ncbi:MAG TPA: alpha/beta hydrolase family protein [Verrucomicrobiae bacterium]|nr:alpha/beta hydrolase family protein [Verrucomicrobiae bacterium]
MNMISRRLALAALLAAACALSPLPLHAAGRAECLSLQSKILKQSVPYCVLLPPSYDSDKNRLYPVLYFLHGLGGNERSFLESGGINLVQDLWDQRKIGEFLMVFPDGYDSFYINSYDGRFRYEDFFLREFIPDIETRYRVEPGRKFRGISGISMGGYGALHLAFAHPKIFGSVSAHSAALMEKLPQFSGNGPPGLAKVNPEYWNENNPLTLAKFAHLSGLEIYFDCGTEDDYGFYAGAKILDEELAKRRIPHEFHLYPGAHNWEYFAAHIPASLEFHSKAFGLNPSER